MEDTPGSIIITKDMADYLFPGQNPVGRTLSDSEKLTKMNYTEPIAGVIGSMRGAGYSDDIPYMLQNVADMVGDYGGDQMYAFRLKPGVDGDRFLEKASREWWPLQDGSGWRRDAGRSESAGPWEARPAAS